jgi:hypothetical protein
LWKGVNSYIIKQAFVANAPTDFTQETKVSVANQGILKTKTILKETLFTALIRLKLILECQLVALTKMLFMKQKTLATKTKLV